MIDEKKLIEKIDRLREKYDEMCGSAQMNEEYGMEMMYAGKVTGLHEIKKFIMNQPKIGEWIPCSERLPSEADFIASYRRNKYSAEFVVMIEGATRPTTLYFRKTGSWVDENGNMYKVTAWQPLPEPYKGE